VSAHHLAGVGERKLSEVGLPIAVVTPHATLSDTLNEMLTARYSTAVVVDDSGAYAGVVEIDTINEAIRGMRTRERSAARDRLEAGAEADSTP
jgi:osmoprotectant transport system ATP-binding protein